MFSSRQDRGELERLHAQVAELRAELARGIRLDPVTGLLTLRSFRGRLTEETMRANRYQRPLSLAILAIEDFDVIEIKGGFKAADELLVAIARRLAEGIRSHDLIGRTGHDELGILLPDTRDEDARNTLERLIGELERTGGDIVSGV